MGPYRAGATPSSQSGRLDRRRMVAVVLSVAVAASSMLFVGPTAPVAANPSDPAVSSASPAAVDGATASRTTTGWPPSGIASSIARLLGAIEEMAPAQPEIRTIRLKPRPRRGPFSMNLYTAGDFVHQQTPYWCIASATQTMINIMEDGRPNRSKKYQKRLHFQARAIDDRYDWFWAEVAGQSRWDQGLHGLGIRDWAMILDAKGYGPYELDRATTRKAAIRKAARAMRLTGRPVGLVVWRGAHAWVMSGFRATADPAYTNEFKVTDVFISDPWYPSVSAIWGRSRPPDSRVPVRALAADYLPYDRPGRRHPKRDGKYMLVLPTLPPGVQVKTKL